MNKLGKILMLFSVLILTLIIGGCSRTNIEPPDITVHFPTTSSGELQSASVISSGAEPGGSSDVEIPPPPPPPPPIVEVSVSARNRFISGAREFTVDEENLQITLDASYENYVDLRTLEKCFLDIEAPSGECLLEGAVNEDGSIDLTKEAYLTVTDGDGERKRFALTVNRTVHDLPIINIRLGNLAPPYTIQRDEYFDMEMYIDCSGSGEFPDTGVLSGKIRGRGHSSWQWAKKPYRLKLDEAVPIMGSTENRDWILLSNHADKSLIRNIVAYDMGRELGTFVWTARQYPVDLFINGEYQGVYAIGEHREVAESRIALDESDDVDRGYLLEVGGADGEDMVKDYDYFHTNSRSAEYVTFTDPKADKLTDEQRQFVKDYVNAADKAIVSGGDYEEYIDVDSFVDWVIIQELTCNLDSCFRRSCYITKDKGGKLRMGPIWDFDLAFGNFELDKAYDTWFTIGTDDEDAYIYVNWCNYLMKDEKFRARLEERWFEVRDTLLDAAEKSIAENTAKIYASQAENFRRWNNLGYKSGYQPWATANIGTYDGQIEYLRSFIQNRAKWIDENISNIEMNNPLPTEGGFYNWESDQVIGEWLSEFNGVFAECEAYNVTRVEGVGVFQIDITGHVTIITVIACSYVLCHNGSTVLEGKHRVAILLKLNMESKTKCV